MAITYVASKLLEFASRTGMEIEKPAGTVANDILVVYPYLERKAKLITVENTLVEVTPQKDFSIFRQAVMLVKHDGTAGKIKATWAGNEATNCVLAVDAFRGVDLVNPVDVTGELKEFTTKTPIADSVTTLTKNTREIIMEVNTAGTGLAKTPAGFVLNTNYSPATISRAVEAEGATGTTELELEVSQNGARLTFALRAAGEETKQEVQASSSVRARRGLTMR